MYEIVQNFLDAPLLAQYLMIGIGLYGALMVSVVIGIFRSIIEFATVEKPSMENISVAPCLTLQTFAEEYTNEPQSWIAQAFGNLLIFTIGGAVGVGLGWGILPFLMAQKSINTSRKKRFG